VSLASLESVAQPAPEQPASRQHVLRDVSFTAPAGRLTALVGPSGAGKTTITHLVARLYDPGAGTVRIGGADIRDVTLASLRETVGVVTQDAHLFLDEATAHLDSESEAAVQRALKAALAGRTPLVIAHRLSTIRQADQILVVDGGRIRERGSHAELLAAGGLYAELHRTQFAPQDSATGASAVPAH
jgi:ABC-type multidrug transport system fused ATPase/permease subunit